MAAYWMYDAVKQPCKQPPFLFLTLISPSFSILYVLLCFWVSPCLNYRIPHWDYVSEAKGLGLHAPFVPSGWKAVDNAEPLSLRIPFHPGLRKSRVLGREDRGKCRQHHVSALVPGLLWGSKIHCESLSGNSFSSKLILFSFYSLIKQTSKMMREFYLAHFLWQQSIFPALPLHLPSIL